MGHFQRVSASYECLRNGVRLCCALGGGGVDGRSKREKGEPVFPRPCEGPDVV